MTTLVVALAAMVVSRADATGGAVTLTSSNATVAPGAQVTLTAGMPVSDVGTVTQEIVQTIDPTKMKLTSLADITYPAGWNLSYCSGAATDCTAPANFSATTPANAAAWTMVKAVKATGAIDSQGVNSGRQVAQSTVSGGSVSQTPTTLPASALGLDGFKVFFDASRTRVFNLYHHSSSGNNNFDCYVVLTGARCVGFPYRFGGTTGETSLGVVVGSTAWLGGNDGLYCVDLSAVLANTSNVVGGGSPSKCFAGGSSALLTLKAGSRFDWFTGASVLGQSAETKLYALDTTSGSAMVYCVDTATRSTCSTPTIDPGLPGSGSQPADGSNIFRWDDLLFVSVANMNATPTTEKVTCVRISTGAKCPGWSTDDAYTSPTFKFGKFVPIPSVGGSIRAVCYYRIATSHSCWETDGTPRTAADYNFPNFNTTNSGGTYAYGVPTQIGSRVYYGNSFWGDPTPSYSKAEVICYDAAAFGGAGGRCNDDATNLSSATNKNYVNYTVTPDPVIPNCLWIAQHSNPVFKTVNVLTGELGCSAIAPNRATFAGATSVPRMGCSATSSVAEWASFTLVSPTSGFMNATLTVQTASGVNVAGWTDVPMVAGAPIDLSTLAVATTGQSPNFVVDLRGASGVSNATARIRVVGDVPQLCLTPTTLVACPTGSGPIVGLSSSSMLANASGTATNSSNNTATLNPASTVVTISAPTGAQCGGSLSGRTGDASLGSAGTAAPGVVVALLDSTGAAVTVDGSPVTATTDASGNYSFGYLLPGSYKVGFPTSGTKSVSSATVVSGAAGTSVGTANAVAGVATSNVASVAVGTNAVVNGLYSLPLSVANDVSSGGQGVAQTKNVLSNDTAGSGGTLTASAVKLCAANEVSPNCTFGSASAGVVVEGQGKYTVNASGEVTFTPCNGVNTPVMVPACTGVFTGQATGLSYQVTDGSSTTSATYTPTVVPSPTAVADTGSGAFDTNQVFTPFANDTPATVGATPYPFDMASVKICSLVTADGACTGTANVVEANQGTWSVNAATGVVTFDPLPSFTGPATAIKYCVADSVGQRVCSTITPTVQPPGPSVAVADTSVGVVDAVQTKDLLANDPVVSGVTLSAGSARLCGSGQTAPNCSASTLDVTNVGSYAITNGTVTFTPCTAAVTANCTTGTSFIGAAPAVGYQVTDTQNRTVSSTYTPSVAGPPTLVPDSSSGAIGVTQSAVLLVNDQPSTGTTMLSASLRLCDPRTNPAQTPNNCTVGVGSSIDIVDVGTYMVSANGVVSFTPCGAAVTANCTLGVAFVGVAAPVTYQATDSLGQFGSSTYTATVTPPAVPGFFVPSPPPPSGPVLPPSASPDASFGARGVPQTVAVISNDRAGNTSTSLVPSSIRLCDGGSEGPDCSRTELVVPNEGTYRVNPNGTITFTPDPMFEGSATPQRYVVTDVQGRVAMSTVAVTVVPPPAPITMDDIKSGPLNMPIVFDPIANDRPGDVPAGESGSVTLVRSSLRLCGAEQTVPNCSATTVTTVDGTYVVDVSTGWVVFTPRPGFSGSAVQPVTYQIANDWGGASGIGITSAVIVAVIDPAPPTLPVTGGDGHDPTGGALVFIAIGVVAVTAARRGPRRV